jgi:putative hydrolases of HD superfamily
MAKPDISRLAELHDFLLQFQMIKRGTYHPSTKERESDVEHSYYLAMAGWMLAPHFDLDTSKVIRLALAHDLVEVHSGDTPAYGDQKHVASKDDREHAALEKLTREWADFPDMLACIEDYKHKSSEEAKFVYALDKVMPAIMSYLGEGYAWKIQNITIDDFIAEKEKKIPRDSPIYPYYEELLAVLRDKPHYFYQKEQT